MSEFTSGFVWGFVSAITASCVIGIAFVLGQSKAYSDMAVYFSNTPETPGEKKV